MDVRRRADDRPVEVVDATVDLERLGMLERLALVLVVEARRVHVAHTGRHLETAGAADGDDPPRARATHAGDQRPRDVGQRVSDAARGHGADDGVGPGCGRRHAVGVGDVRAARTACPHDLMAA
jgi:hypothetical protein